MPCRGADVFIGVSAGEIVTPEMISVLNCDPIIFALANPTPEIMPDLAKQGGAAIVGTGRSNLPNQINNVLAFPGIFRGALDVRATRINELMKVAAVHAIADYLTNPISDQILPEPLDKGVVSAVAEWVRRAGSRNGSRTSAPVGRTLS
jgi:malate dehydrogenase (oxaloacetate-decarboxylating)